MNDSEGDGILLNVTSKSISRKPVEQKDKEMKFKQSCSARKSRTTGKSGSVKASVRKSSLHQENVSIQNENCKKTEKSQVISSLFRKNPALPDISSDVHQIEGNVDDQTFSGSEFRSSKLAPFMISNLEKNLCLSRMTSIQKASLPSLLSGKDVFISAPTGTGKTLSYVIPMVQSLQAIVPKIQRKDGPYCLILVPTRELATQTLAVIQQVLKPFIWIVPGSVTGGERRKSEKSRLRKGINILVATPGRLVDHLKTTKCLVMSKLQWLVLDEADRLLDLGFEQNISFILSIIKQQTLRKVQKVLVSATLSQGVENLVDVNLDTPIAINMKENGNLEQQDAEYQIPSLLEQFCVVAPMKLRLVTLTAFLLQKYQENCKIIVFFTTQDSVDFHFMLYSSTLTTIEGNALELMKLHGKLSQNERADVFSEFKRSKKGILFCTDIAARGLDLPSVKWIVQYNPPVSSTEYVHRVGRTARIGMSGQALLFLLPNEVKFLNVLREQNIRLSELKMNDILTQFARSLCGTGVIRSEAHFHSLITEQQLKFEETVCQNNNLKTLSLTAFKSFIGAYNTFPSSVKHVFHPRNLHLGHLAKSFALREAPSELETKISKTKKNRRYRHGERISAVAEPLTKKFKRM